MQLNLFDGGLSTRLAEHLIQQNEAVEFENVDSDSGILKPKKSDLPTNTEAKRSMYYFNNNWIFSDDDRDYVEFQEKLYYSTASGKAKKSSDGIVFHNLGIDKPETYASKLSESQPILSKGRIVTYKYDDPFGFRSNNNPSGKGYPFTLNSGDSFWDGETTELEVIFKRKYSTQFGYAKYTPANLDRLKGSSKFVICKTSGIISGNTDLDTTEFFVKQVGVDDDFYQYGVSVVGTFALSFSEFTVDGVCPKDKKNVKLIQKYPNYKDNIIILDKPVDITVGTSGKYQNTRIQQVDYYYPTEISRIEFYTTNPSTDPIRIMSLDPEGTYKTIASTQETDSKCYITNLVPKDIVSNLKFYITHYNSKDGTESPPSDEIKLPDLLPIQLKIGNISDPQVDRVRLYGIVGGYSQPVLIKEVYANQTSISISSQDVSNVSNQLLNSYNNLPPPEGMVYLIQANAMLFGAKDFNLHYSSIGQPNYWSPYDFITFNDRITGIGNTQNGLLVFTRSQTYIITGNSPATYSKFLLDGSQGCISHKSIKTYNNNLIWLSNESLLLSNGGLIRDISRDKLDKLSITNVYDSAIYNDIYYLATPTNTLIADMRNGLVYSYSSEIYIGLHYNRHRDSLYACLFTQQLVIVEGDKDKPKNLTYKSPKFPSGSISSVKNYKTFYVNSTGDLTLEVIVDDRILTTAQLQSGIQEVRIPNDARLGYYVQFKVTGTGILNEIEFKQEDRQNGR